MKIDAVVFVYKKYAILFQSTIGSSSLFVNIKEFFTTCTYLIYNYILSKQFQFIRFVLYFILFSSTGPVPNFNVPLLDLLSSH